MAELLSRERVTSKQAVAVVREPLTRAARCGPAHALLHPAVVTATEQWLNALSNVEDTARLEAALATLGQAVNAATALRLSRRARCRAVRTG